MSSTALITTLLLIPPLFLLLWTLTSTNPGTGPLHAAFPTLYNQRICLLIAHPDDEAMFFAPTLLALTRPELGNHVKILCLSSGDASGLGSTRKTELTKSALLLGLGTESDVFVLDDPDKFPDSMTTTWPADAIADLLSSAFAPAKPAEAPSSNLKTRRDDGAPTATIDVLITFDKDGVSGHANHRSLYHGAVAFLRGLMKGKAGWECPVTLYTLTSTNVVRKYLGVLDAPVTMVLGVLGGLFGGGDGTKNKGAPGKKSGKAVSARLLFVSGLGEYGRARRAMVRAHVSQMVWFRWGWITVGRYMVVNDLKRERVLGV